MFNFEGILPIKMTSDLIKTYLIATLILIFMGRGTSAYSQDTVIYRSESQEFKVYFQFDKSNFNPYFRSNGQTVARMLDEVDRMGIDFIDSIVVVSKSSPEGVYEHNIKLSKRRASSMRNWIARQRPDVVPLMKMRSEGEAWGDLRALIEADTLISDKQKERALAVIDSDVNVGTKKWRMEQLPIYRYLLGTHYRVLRNSAICIIYSKPEISISCEEIEYGDIVIEEMEPLKIDTVRVEPMEYGKRELFFVRTNFLVPLQNLGVEVPIGNRWSVAADYYFPWFFREESHERCFQVLAWNLEGRYWFGKERKVEDRLEGHSVGLFAMGGYYDLQKDYKGYQGTAYNVGVDYMYALPIFKDRLHLEFSLGMGFFISPEAQPYDVFEPGGLAYKKGYTVDISNWLVPKKAAISLVVPIKAGGGAKRR